MSEQKISSDIFDITNFVNSLKSKYIPVENEETLYTSTFGYIGEIASNLIQNTIIATSEYSNEAISTRAKFDRNVIIHAMSLGIDKVNAVPATMKVSLCIPESCVVNNLGNRKSGDRKANEFVLDRTIPFNIEGVEFHLDYDIIITRINNKELSSKTIYTARYDRSQENPISNIQDEILPSVGVFKYTNNDNLLVIFTELRQVMYNEVEEVVSTENDILNKTMGFTFNNQMAYFDVAVYEGNSETPTKILTPIYDGLYKENVTDYCYYSYVNSNNIRIRFDRNVYRPSINTKIVVRIYTTLGNDGNFKYSEDAKFILPSTSNLEYASAYVIFKQRGEGSVDGIDRATTKELQNIIPREQLSRGFMTTTTDLRNYFNSLATENNIVYPFRKEDSFLSRKYYAFCLMKDDMDNVLPTNTIPIKVPTVISEEGASSGKSIFIESGTPIILLGGSKGVTFKERCEMLLDGLDSTMISSIDNGNKIKEHNVILKIKGTNHYYLGKAYECSGNSETGRFRLISVLDIDTVNNATEDGVLNKISGKEPIMYKECEVLKAIDTFVYTCPYTLEIKDETVGSAAANCRYYMDSINENRFLSFDYVNTESDIQFIASNIRIRRASFMSELRYDYILDMNLIPNIGMSERVDVHDIQAVAVYKDSEGNTLGYSIGYIFGKDETSYKCRFRFKAAKIDGSTFTSDGKIKINEVYNPNIIDGEEITKMTRYMPENVSVEIYTLYRYANNSPTTVGILNANDKSDVSAAVLNTVSPEFSFPEWIKPEELDKCHYMTNPEDSSELIIQTTNWWYDENRDKAGSVGDDMKYMIKDMVVTNKYTIKDGINLFYNYSDKVESHVSHTTTGEMIVQRVPVVKYLYMNSEERVDFFLTELRKDMNYVNTVLDHISSGPKLETLFTIDCKLFNTYGPSNMYNTITRDGRISSTHIHCVNLGLNFRTQLYSDADKAIIEQIKSDIKIYIENIKEMADIHIPNLITQITKSYGEYFTYFEFTGFDYEDESTDANYQHIITDADMENLTTVPEFLNISFNDITGEPDINITLIS